jgi:hypothetical protein
VPTGTNPLRGLLNHKRNCWPIDRLIKIRSWRIFGGWVLKMWFNNLGSVYILLPTGSYLRMWVVSKWHISIDRYQFLGKPSLAFCYLPVSSKWNISSDKYYYGQFWNFMGAVSNEVGRGEDIYLWKFYVLMSFSVSWDVFHRGTSINFNYFCALYKYITFIRIYWEYCFTNLNLEDNYKQ